MKHTLTLAVAAAVTTTMLASTAVAAPGGNGNGSANGKDKASVVRTVDVPAGKGKGHAYGKAKVPAARTVDVQILQFSDFHGHLQPEVLNTSDKPPVYLGTYGGAAYLAGLINELSEEFEDSSKHAVSYTVSSGDNIGGSTFVSGLFHDEPTIEILNAMGLTASAVGNHEFDEGVDELLRIVEGGNHPEDGQYLESPYAGADFPYLAANVVWKDSGEPILPAYTVENHKGVKVGFIGVVTDTTSSLVAPAGIEDVTFLDEAETINRYAAELQARGVEAIVALVHEGGADRGAYSSRITTADVNAGCDTLAGAILDINRDTTSAVDVLLSGHTHNSFACELPDPEGVNRAVAGPGDWGRVLSETTFTVDRKTKDVLRDSLEVQNHVVDTAVVTPDADVQAIVDKWQAMADVLGQRVVGHASQPITGDANANRAIETPLANFVADAILWGTQDQGADIAFINVGGVRASIDAGPITYAEAYAVLPFSNYILTFDMTGAQIEAVLNQQYQNIPARGTRPMLALGVSKGFTYTWDAVNRRVVPGSMQLNGKPILANETYQVSTINFLAEGGDSFTAFNNGTPRTGDSEDLANFVAYLDFASPVTPPGDRVTGL